MVNNISAFKTVREVRHTVEELQRFEEKVAKSYEAGEISGPIHLSDGNEEQLIEIFSKVSKDDWVFSAWRNHYHALLHGIEPEWLYTWISSGKSMGVVNKKCKFYTSSIVGGIIPISLGVALANKKQNNSEKVWCFIGDMTFETGLFHEAYKYAANFDLNITFVIEDNSKSVTTDTDLAWGKKSNIPDDVVHYHYTSKYPHHGTGKWVNF